MVEVEKSFASKGVAGLAGLIAANFPNVVKAYGNHPMVIALGVYDTENNAIDVEALYNAFAPRFGTYKIPISIPKIATIKIGREEMEMLMHYIKES